VFPFGSIVLARFPFTDLSGDKRRPALVISRDNDRRPDLVVCFITSVQRSGPDMAAIPTTAGTGLKLPSLVRFDKLATLDRSVIAGKIGAAPADWLHAHRAVFFGVFGFGQPWTVSLAAGDLPPCMLRCAFTWSCETRRARRDRACPWRLPPGPARVGPVSAPADLQIARSPSAH
jgi:mRNA interferase MazF